MYNIVICDNDSNFIGLIKDQLIEAGLDTDRTRFTEYHSGNAFLLSLSQTTAIDLLFLSVDMPDTACYKIADIFRKHFADSLLVFSSSKASLSDTVFDYSPLNYILKDSSPATLSKKFKSITDRLLSTHPTPHIIAAGNNTFFTLLPTDIMYISKCKTHRKIKLCSKKSTEISIDELNTKSLLDELYETIKEFDFEYAHSSYIVNFQYVAYFSHNEVVLSDGTKLNISRAKKDYFLARLRSYYGNL
ncbi:MAG: LytTR family transcriptional regulator DNA-binding domain-containing protein [Lachnospiraceae bacterium]|nr:LytTR family transcriptional regulator DNA-binding domain-containing protein [Lachnospiraceae bacterium]MBQ8319227.1 LytTR family transcriptional regulator DNA-binding domain-containing protein [Lachnospiraceae bacterium]